MISTQAWLDFWLIQTKNKQNSITFYCLLKPRHVSVWLNRPVNKGHSVNIATRGNSINKKNQICEIFPYIFPPIMGTFSTSFLQVYSFFSSTLSFGNVKSLNPGLIARNFMSLSSRLSLSLSLKTRDWLAYFTTQAKLIIRIIKFQMWAKLKQLVFKKIQAQVKLEYV